MKSRSASLLLLSLCLSGFPGFASAPPPLYTGLPETLPADYLERDGFVDFAEPALRVRAPIGSHFTDNGTPIPGTDAKALSEIFNEAFYARLPGGTSIKNLDGGWDYPVGTRAVHLIRFNTTPPRTFELRLLEKQTDGSWAFGVYAPDAAGASDQLTLAKYTGFKQDKAFVALTSGRTMNLAFTRVPLNTCQNCHFATTPSNYQYPSAKETGPCGFVPDNPNLQTDWAARYRTRYGQNPFSN